MNYTLTVNLVNGEHLDVEVALIEDTVSARLAFIENSIDQSGELLIVAETDLNHESHIVLNHISHYVWKRR